MEEPMSMGNVATFLTKLWALVEDESYDDLICWSESGTSFHIIDQTSFAQNVLPVFFKHRNISSFIRQLNMYGFRKVSIVETGGVKPGRNDIEFSHPYFIYGREDLLEHIKRKAPVGKAEPAANTLLQRDNTHLLLQEVQKLRERQETFTTKMDAIKRENSALWKELAVMWQRHNKQQVVVSKLLQFLVGMMGKGATTGSGLKRSLLAPLQSAESNGPSMMKRTRASSPTPAQDTSITIEDVTDLTDDVNDSVMAASLLSPLSADVDHILSGIASPPTPDVQSIWNDHGQLVSTATPSLDSNSNNSVSLTTGFPQGLIVISPEGPTNFLANLQQTQQPQASRKKLVHPSSSASGVGNSKLAKILAPASTAAASTSIVQQTPMASNTSVLKHPVVKNAAAVMPNANARLALKAALDVPLLSSSTSSSSSVLKNSNNTAKIGQIKSIATAAAAATATATATEMVGTTLLATGLATGTPSGGAPGTAKTYQLVPMSTYSALQQQGTNSATRILGNNNNRVAVRRPAQVKVTHPTPTAPLVSATQSVGSRALVKRTTNVVMSSAADSSLTDSSNFTSPVASDMLGALDVTQSELDTLQSMLASSQVALNLDTLRELFSPESSMPGVPAIPDLLLPTDQQSMNYDDFVASLTEGHQELNSMFNVDDFINDGAAADTGTNSASAGNNVKDQALVKYANRY